jgi:glyoxylase-like metal-dependent hydrolase (beta-lactamase superfamily II)
MPVVESVQRFETSQGARIYRLPLDLFPELSGFVHIAIFDDLCILFDVGSGFGDSNEQLQQAMELIQLEYGEQIDWADISHVIISHGHIDHFGGLGYVRQKSNAPVIIHSLDRRILTHYEERLALVARRLENYLKEAGLTREHIEGVMAMYMLNKGLFRSQPIDLICEQVGMRIGRMEFMHVPGHCPGQIIARLDDVLLSADHVLETTSPHQAPESLSLSTGLNHYLGSLAKVPAFAAQVKLTLGGHGGPIYDLDARIRDIAGVHHDRLMEILDLTEDACTIGEISAKLFPTVEGYHRLLALEETGAHVEYLHQRDFLTVDNYEEVEHRNGIPIRFRKAEVDVLERLETSFSAFGQAVQECAPPARAR